MENGMKRICGVCAQEILEGDTVRVCEKCGKEYHQSCWDRQGGCQNSDCQQQEEPVTVMAEEQQTVVSDVAQQPEQSCVCTEQQDPIVQDASSSNVADAAIEEVAPTYGVVKTKKKKTVLIVSIIIAVVVLIAGGIIAFITYKNIQEKKRQEAIAQYVTDVQSLDDKVIETGIGLEKIGNKMQEYWYNHIWKNGSFYDGSTLITTTSITDAVKKAKLAMVRESALASGTKKELDDLIIPLKTLPDEKDTKLSKLKDAAEELYKAYEEFYDCVMNPTGNYKSWTGDFGDADKELVDAHKELISQIDEYKTSQNSK